MSQSRSLATTILLIGSTGNGKSTLGNFLLTPEERFLTQRDLQVFKTATSNKPETQHVTIGRDKLMEDEATLKIIDTPGLNESGEQDLRHMVKMVQVLRKLRHVTACILCIKFDTKIDAQYKATIAYYKKLLPDLFEGNILIVLTNFATDRRSERMRKMQGIDVDTVVANTVAEVKREGLVTFSPHVFLIDCLPIDFDPDDRCRQQSEDTRRAILDFIQKTMHQVDVKSLMVAKTDALKQRDTEEIKRLDGEIHGYNVRLKEANAKAERVLADIEGIEKERSDTDQELQRLKEDLKDKDSLGLVTSAEWSLKKEWKFFQWQEESVLCLAHC